MTLADADHYADGFAGVSDWEYAGYPQPTSDGDLGSFVAEGDNNWDIYYTNDPAALDVQYLEVNYAVNVTVSDVVQITLYSSDDRSGSLWTQQIGHSTTAQITHKYSIDVEDVECIAIAVRCPSAIGATFDYLRLGDATEMGWQHDGSTTAGVTEVGAGLTYSTSSDDDILTMNVTYDSSANTGQFQFPFDTTATASDIERDYYPMWRVRVKATQTGSTDPRWGVRLDGYRSDSISISSTWTTYYLNTKALSTANSDKYFYLAATIGSGESCEFEMEYTKAFSIANFTVGMGAGVGTSDVLYVNDDNALVWDMTTSNYIYVTIDPALSIAGATYNVVNVTMTGASDQEAFYMRTYSGGWSAITDGETRWAHGQSGTITDIWLGSYRASYGGTTGDLTISAVKFIEDGTAPDILDKYIDPKEPDDDEATTITTVTSDAIEVYSCTINAVVYPTGFSDVDYAMTETEQEHVWTHDFDTLTAGYYLFQMTASDGANTYSEYISVRVRVAEIKVAPITFFGVGTDFTQMQVSFDLNRDCTYTVYESTDSEAEADTHTGSVVEGWNNIAWDKLTTSENEVDFGIKLVNGSLSTWINGSYSVAQTTFYVETWSPTGDTEYQYTLSGRITKTASYTVYDGNTVKATGTCADLDFTITFTKWCDRDGLPHDFGIMFTNGTQTCWINGTYYSFDEGDYGQQPPPDPPDRTDDLLLLSFFTLIAVLVVGAFLLKEVQRT